MQTSAVLMAVMANPLMTANPVDWALGAEYRYENAAPRRIVFVPTGARYESVETHRRPTQQASVRNIHTRVATFDAYVWAAGTSNSSVDNSDAVEALMNDFISALHLTVGDYELLSDRAAKVDGGQAVEDGIIFVLTFALRVPVTISTESQLLTIVGSSPVAGTSTIITPTNEMDFPDGTSVSGTPAP